MHGLVAVAGTREAELLSSMSVAASQIASATAEFSQAHDTNSTQRRDLVRIVQSKMYIKSLKDNMALYKARGESLKSVFAMATTERARLGQIFDSTREQVVNGQEKSPAKDVIVRSIVEDSSPMLETFLSSLAESFRASLNKSVTEFSVLVPLPPNSIPILPSMISLSVIWEVLQGR